MAKRKGEAVREQKPTLTHKSQGDEDGSRYLQKSHSKRLMLHSQQTLSQASGGKMGSQFVLNVSHPVLRD